MQQPGFVRYRKGAVIDTSKALEVVGLSSSDWGALDVAYPELASTRGASFRSGRNRTLTIYPPLNVPMPMLAVAHTAGSKRTHTIYEGYENNELAWVVIYIRAEKALHIYRLKK